jgi:hypothetical protein
MRHDRESAPISQRALVLATGALSLLAACSGDATNAPPGTNEHLAVQGNAHSSTASPQTPIANTTTSANTSARHVVVNGVTLDAAALALLDGAARTQVPDGDYWYDARCGACGARGGPTAAFIPAGLALAPLRADASGGGNGILTGVFVNGRELHAADVNALARLGQIQPGRYWLDAMGFWGYEGLELPIGNLMAGGDPTGPGYNRTTPGGHLMSDGQTSAWFDPKTGASVLTGG